MYILIKIGIFIFNIIYFFIKLFPIQNKVTFISRQSNDKSIDISLLEGEIKRENKNVKVVILCKTLDNKLKYFFHMFRQMYHVATSKVVVLDGYCIVVSILKQKKETTIIQMWHALGAFKKFGYSILNQEEGSSEKTAKVMKMHNNYNYAFVSGEACIQPYSEAFRIDKKNIKIMPLPRVDLLRDKGNKKRVSDNIYKIYPILREKKNILYAPTFRKNKDSSEQVKELINSIDYSKYNLIIKLHPLTKIDIVDDRVIFDKNFTTLDMMYISDYVITDYSAILFEVAVLEKPIYFWTYDYEEYLNGRNFYLDFTTEIPGPMSSDVNNIIKFIEKDKYDLKKLKEFQKKYVAISENATKKMSKFILRKFKG